MQKIIMNQTTDFIKRYKKGIIFTGALLIILILIEAFVFNRWFLVGKIFRLEERHYLISKGILYHFKLENSSLVAQDNDPNISFSNVNLPIAAISFECVNSIPGAMGQLFYSKNGEAYNELQSIIYNVPLSNNLLLLGQSLGIPRIVTVSSLRFDLTDIPGDTVTCSEFVINPNIHLILPPARLALYAVLLLFGLSFVYRNSKAIIFLRSRKTLLVIVFSLFVVLLGAKLIPISVQKNLLFIVLFCIMLFSCTVTYALGYLYLNSPDEKGSFVHRYKYEIALVSVIVITTLPLLTQPYYYYDDWWGIGIAKTSIVVQNLFLYGRPIQSLFFNALNNISIRNAYIFKWAFLPFVLLYACLLYRWLRLKTQDQILSFFLACLLSIFPPVMDILGYTSTSPVSFSILGSVLSVICFDRAYSMWGERKRFYLLLNMSFAFIFLFGALLTYQIGPQIVFLFLSVEIYFNSRKGNLLKKNLIFLFLFGLANGFYLVIIKILNKIYLVDITTNRAQIINTLSQIYEKAHLYKLVLEQSVMQLITSFTGDSIILQRYRGYIISFSNQQIGTLLFLFVVLMILAALASYWFRTKNIVGLLSLIVFIPMSYFVFLALSNNGYLTYYAFAHISLLMFYFLMGLIATIQYLWGKIKLLLENEKGIRNNIKPALILAPLLVLCALISNYYIRDFYISYNSAVYNFIKYNLQTALHTNPVKRIHIIGTISPINADIYSRFVTITALNDLGQNASDYDITVSANRYYPERLEESDYMNVRQRISEQDRQRLDELYTFEPTYRQYYVKPSVSDEDRIELQRIFILADVIPQASSPDTLIIDITWTTDAYYMH